METKPKILFFGNHNIGYNCLKWLIDRGENVVGVIAIPEDPTEESYYASVSSLANQNNIPLFQTNNPNSPEMVNKIRQLNPDIIFSISYRFMISKQILDIPRMGAINFHGAYLPNYRGCAPINWVIINGERETGVTLHYMDEKPDHGDIIAQEKILIDLEDTAEKLFNKVTETGFELFKRTYPLIASGTAPRIKQPEKGTYFGRRTPKDGVIDWDKSSLEIYNLVRALTKPFPGAFTYLNEKKIFIWRAKILENINSEVYAPGTIISSDNQGFVVSTGDSRLSVEEFELESTPELEIYSGQKFQSPLKKDKEVFDLIEKELTRQKNQLNMIPSENYCSEQVLLALGSVLNNKYSEGYPKKRYYQGNKIIDKIESLAIERAKEIFGAEHVNVQPHSGSQANMAVYRALLKKGDKILAMILDQGGHLTHGSPVNFSGQDYNFIYYTVDKETGKINMDEVREIAEREKPKLIISGFTAYPQKIDFKQFHEIAKSIGAYSMADISHIAGLVAAGVHESPLPFTDVVTTTTHKTLRGPKGAIILCKNELAEKIDKAVFPGLQGGPHEHTIAAKAVAFQEALEPPFNEYSKNIVENCKSLAESLKSEGIQLVSGGTENHLILIDLIKTLGGDGQGKGREIARALEEAGIITNANTIPFDPATPLNPSGIRLGTPCLTTRGMREPEMRLIAKYISEVVKNPSEKLLKEKVNMEVKELCKKFPIYERIE